MSVFLLPGGTTLATTGLPLYAPVLSGPSPNAPLAGQFWYDPVAHEFKFQDNTETIVLGTSTTPNLTEVLTTGADASSFSGVTTFGGAVSVTVNLFLRGFTDDQILYLASGDDGDNVVTQSANLTFDGTTFFTNKATCEQLAILNGILVFTALGTSDPHNAGQVWNSSGVLHISAG